MAKKLDQDIADIPEQSLMDVWEAIKDGAKNPAEAIGFDEPSLIAFERMALGYYRAMRYGAAGMIYGFILRLDPQRSSAWRGLGAVAMVLKEYELAIQSFKRAVMLAPKDPVSKVFLGECLCHMGKKNEGLDLLREVVKTGTKIASESPYITRARAIVGADGGVPSRVVLKRAGKQLIQESDGFFEHVNLEEAALQFDEDREIQWEDIKKNPQLMKVVKELKGMVADGKLTLAQVGGFTDNELDGAYAVACKCVETGQIMPAIQILGYLIFIDPYKARYHQLVGICMQRLDQHEAAQQYYQLAEAMEPEDPMTRIYHGEAKLMCGKVDDGLDSIRKGIALAQRNASAHKDLIARGNTLLKQFSA